MRADNGVKPVCGNKTAQLPAADFKNVLRGGFLVKSHRVLLGKRIALVKHFGKIAVKAYVPL